MARWKDAWNMLVRKLKLRGQSGLIAPNVPAAAVLILTTFAPSVAASAPQSITVPTQTLTVTGYPPTVTGPAPLVVTPAAATLTVTERVPTVTFSLHQLVTPTTRELLLTGNAPTVNGAVGITVPKATLTVTRFAPSIFYTQTVTPTTRALTLTGHAPSVTSANHLVVTPMTKALATTRFAPTVTPTVHQLLTPAKKTLTVTRYAPFVTALGGASFFMAPGGSDAAAGTEAAPWASIQKFINTNPAPGSTLYLRDGNYTQSEGGFSGRDSTYGQLIGTASQPITIRNYPGETPIFSGVAGTVIAFWPNEIANTVGSSYVVLDGIQFPLGDIDDEAVVVIGGQEPTLRLVNNITIRNCYFSLANGTTGIDHMIGIIHNAEDITIEDCEFRGPVSTATTGGCGIAFYSQPATRRVTVQRCIFHDIGWNAIQVWDYATAAPVATIDIKHCTFKSNSTDIDLRYHSTALVQDCVFDSPNTTAAIYDPFHSAATTRDHNYFSQTLTGSYGLTAGSAAINGAHDGTDAGAVPYP